MFDNLAAPLGFGGDEEEGSDGLLRGVNRRFCHVDSDGGRDDSRLEAQERRQSRRCDSGDHEVADQVTRHAVERCAQHEHPSPPVCAPLVRILP